MRSPESLRSSGLQAPVFADNPGSIAIIHRSMPSTLLGLYRYPLKSAAAECLDAATVEPRGLAGDRRWMVVDADGRFVTGRQHARLPLVRARVEGDDLLLAATGMPELRVSPAPEQPRIAVTVWKDRVDAQPADHAADAWISGFLGQPARLVHMDMAAHRAVDPGYARPGDEVSFADGFPLLAISQASLDGLNARLGQPVSMLRFRPNLVIGGTTPHAEDGWRRVRIGEVEFDVVKPCTRCVFTTVDPERGERDPSGEPLRTLLGYRRGPTGVTFGQNLIPRGNGTLRLGDAVEALV